MVIHKSMCRAQESPQGHSKWRTVADLLPQPWCNKSSSDCLGSQSRTNGSLKNYLPNALCVKEELKTTNRKV